MTISERVERIRTELAETRATFNPQWLAANGPRPKAPAVRCRMCGEYGITCFEPGGVYVDTGLCPDCEGEGGDPLAELCFDRLYHERLGISVDIPSVVEAVIEELASGASK